MSFSSYRNEAPKPDPSFVKALQSILRVSGYGQSVIGLAMVLLGLWFQDGLHVMWFTLTSTTYFLYVRYLNRIPFRHQRLTLKVLLGASMLGGQFVLPQGPASAMLIYVFVTIVLILSESLKRGLIVSAIGLSLYFLFPLIGLVYPIETNVPSWCSFGLLLLSATIALSIQFSRARQTVSESMENLAATEQSIEREMAEISRRNLLLHEGNRSLERGTLFLTDTLKAEAQSTSKLSAKRDDQKRLTNAIHHDMREPIRGIVSFSQLIRRKLMKRPEAEGVQEYLGFAIDGGQRMAIMLDDLLLYSKNNHTETPHPISLTSLLAEVQGDLFDLIERSEAKVIVAKLPNVTGFETQLKQLFQNLLSNALKFRREDLAPQVIIRPLAKQPDASKFVIEIKDNGVGIPENQLDKVFGLFNRAHEGGSYEGSGVGLALCRRIAISHAATLTVESTIGEGTTFYLALPQASLDSARAMSFPPLNQKKVSYD
ncbi:MAG: ATP-binding protein [Saprospiraceae bacterium]